MSDSSQTNQSTNDKTAKITIYTTPTCGFCHMVKNYLDGKDISYSAIDITQDEAGYKAVLDKTGQLGVPVTDIDGIVIVGFDRPKIDLALKQKSLA